MSIYPSYIMISSRRYREELTATGVFRVRMPHDHERVNISAGDDRYIPNTGLAVKGKIRQSVIDLGKPLPEVYRFYPFHSVPLTKPLQLLWKGINPEFSGEKWRRFLGSSLAFTNNSTGFGGGTCHADYVNNRDLTCTPPLFDQSRFCGGAEFRAKQRGDLAIIESIRVDLGKLPTAEELLASPHLWFYGASIAPSGNIYYMRKMALDGTLTKIRIPLFTTREIYLPMDEVHVLGEGENYEPHEVVYK